MKRNVTKDMRSRNTLYAMSARHAVRLVEGKTEGAPGDYRLNSSEEAVKQRDARKRLEDMKLAQELGLNIREIE